MTDPTPAPAPVADPTPAPAPAAPAAFDWKTAGLDDASMAFVSEKQFKDMTTAIQSHRNLEKLVGVPADKLLRLPTDDSPEAWNAVYDKLGRPKDAAGYNLPLPAGANPDFAKAAGEWFHGAGLTIAQARKVTEAWNAHMTGATKAATEAAAETEKADIAKLKSEWGPAWEQHANLVDTAAKRLGMTVEQLQALKAAMGNSAAMKFMHNIGTKVGIEGDWVEAGKAGAIPPTKEQAQAQIAQLRGSGDFAKRFNSPDVSVRSEARKEMARLHQLAYPESTAL